MSDRFVIVGGDAAGMSAASKAKRDRPALDVVVFERGEWVAYGACGIPYYVEGTVDNLDDLVVVDPERVEARGIDLRREHAVVDVDADATAVTVEGPDGERTVEPYDSLLLATGGRGVRPDVPGGELRGVFTVRNLEAGRRLRNAVHPSEDGSSPSNLDPAGDAALRASLAERTPDAVGVLGANKIGLELAEAMLARGLSVHVFEAADRILPSFGADIAAVVADHLRERGVTLHLDADVTTLSGDGGRVGAVETSEGSVAVDLVVADLGVEPNTELAADAGVELGPTGAIARDEFGRTSAPDVFAAGDCAEKHHLLSDAPIRWPYGLAANRAGRAIGRTVAGTPTRVGDVVGTGVMKTVDLELSRTGFVTEVAAREAGFEPIATTITSITRAHYYPGWSRIVVHLLADERSGRLLGGGLVGREGAAHRINAVATALHAGMSVEELGSLDLGYAPPFGPVWDPILTAAKVLAGDLES